MKGGEISEKAFLLHVSYSGDASFCFGTCDPNPQHYLGAHLSFDGNNASCVIQIVGDKMTDEISATMELRCGSDLIASWNGSGSGILKMTKSAAVKKGKTYTMVVSFSVNGTERSPVTISATNG